MRDFPADSTVAAGAVAQESMSNALNSAEFLGVQVQEISRMLVFIALDHRAGLEQRQALQA